MKKSVLLLLALSLALALASGTTPADVVPGEYENFHGPTRLGVILVRFQDIPVDTDPWTEFSQDDRDRIKGWLFDPAPGPSVNHLFREMSFETDILCDDDNDFCGDIIGTVTIESNGYEKDKYCLKDYKPMWTTWRDQALAEADPTGMELVYGGPAEYDMLMFVFSQGNRCDGPFAGVNGVAHRQESPTSGDPLPYTLIFDWSTPQTMAHEIGHLKGWGHAALGGFTGPGQAYGDYSCVMGENYAYANHPESSEFDFPPDEDAVPLPMRHASAPLKIYSKYINEGDLFSVLGPATETVFLAPTELKPSDFPDPPNEAPIHHAAVIALAEIDRTYTASYRRGSLSAYDGDPALSYLMGRVQIHSFHPSVPGNIVREKLLEAGETFVHDNFTVTAVTDGQNDEPFVEIEIAVPELYRPRVSLPPSLIENNSDGLDAGPIQVTVKNLGPSDTTTADFVLTLGDELSPEIAGGIFVPSALTLPPGESGTADLTLQFTGPLVDGDYAFEVVATDPVGPRAAGKGGGSYTVDSVDPVVLNLRADHQGDLIVLSWDNELLEATYTIETLSGQDWVALAGPGYLPTDFFHTHGIVPGSSHTYRVRGTDKASNTGSWATITATDPCVQGFSATIDPMDFQVNQTIYGDGVVATYDVTVTNLNPVGCDADSYTVMSIGSPHSGYGIGATVIHDVAPGTIAHGTLLLEYSTATKQPVPLDDVRFGFDVDLIGPYANRHTIEGVRFTLDTVGPTAPPALSGTQNNVRVELNWLPSTDATTGVASYRILRNGAYLGATNQLSYLDFNAPSERPLTYTVLAIDEVGHLSAPANVVFTTNPGCPKCPQEHEAP